MSRSETDSEVIAQLIGQYVKEGDSLLDAVNRTQDKLQGTWGLAILDRENPTQLIAAKNGMPHSSHHLLLFSLSSLFSFSLNLLCLLML